jgi:hypothetical protein
LPIVTDGELNEEKGVALGGRAVAEYLSVLDDASQRVETTLRLHRRE